MKAKAIFYVSWVGATSLSIAFWVGVYALVRMITRSP